MSVEFAIRLISMVMLAVAGIYVGVALANLAGTSADPQGGAQQPGHQDE